MYRTYKHKNKIICYITENNNKYTVHTGKPSDSSCLCWQYDNIYQAEAMATEFYTNYIKSIGLLIK